MKKKKSAKKLPQLSKLEDLRDEILANYEKRHSKPDIGAMCEPDLELLRHWHWNRYVLCIFTFTKSLG